MHETGKQHVPTKTTDKSSKSVSCAVNIHYHMISSGQISSSAIQNGIQLIRFPDTLILYRGLY